MLFLREWSEDKVDLGDVFANFDFDSDVVLSSFGCLEFDLEKLDDFESDLDHEVPLLYCTDDRLGGFRDFIERLCPFDWSLDLNLESFEVDFVGFGVYDERLRLIF